MRKFRSRATTYKQHRAKLTLYASKFALAIDDIADNLYNLTYLQSERIRGRMCTRVHARTGYGILVRVYTITLDILYSLNFSEWNLTRNE